ncbi:MAG: hypothetical protein KC422_08815 [Trueperaceae bacterium]|nr:hypothetical protein [Trueperaceae bacterium]
MFFLLRKLSESVVNLYQVYLKRYVYLAFFFLFCLVQAKSFPLEQVVPGLSGYALTAGAGNLIERFPVQVLGVQQDAGTGFPLVLVKASGPFIEQTGGVAAGMSGSPVYLPGSQGDELLGAIAYVFPSSDHSLALVTPIEIMRGVKLSALSYLPSGPDFAKFGEVVPVATPILMSGLSDRAAKVIGPLFKNTQLSAFPVQLAGVAGWDETAYRLEPGSAISVQLVKGDVTLAAVGTVTAIENDIIYAFGHPFFGEGEVSFAFAPAFISYIVPSDVVPFKLANNGFSLLGTIHEDRPPAIVGTLGTEPAFLPVTLTLQGSGDSLTKRFEISNDERYYAPLLASAIVQLFDEAYQKVAAGTADLAWEISLSNGTVVRVLEQITDPGDIAGITAGLAAEPLQILADNIFQKVEIERVALNISYEETERYADIVELVADQEELQKGEALTLHIRLQPYRKDPEVKTIRLELPEEAEGSLDITVRGGMEGSDGNAPDGEPILSFAELVAALNDNIESSELIVETYIDGEPKRLERLRFPYLIQGEESFTVQILDEEGETTDTSNDPEPKEAEPDDSEMMLP